MPQPLTDWQWCKLFIYWCQSVEFREDRVIRRKDCGVHGYVVHTRMFEGDFDDIEDDFERWVAQTQFEDALDKLWTIK